jgi:hypothetical protein
MGRAKQEAEVELPSRRNLQTLAHDVGAQYVTYLYGIGWLEGGARDVSNFLNLCGMEVENDVHCLGTGTVMVEI